jgi:hypothetical protein
MAIQSGRSVDLTGAGTSAEASAERLTAGLATASFFELLRVRPEDSWFLAQTEDAIWSRVERSTWASDAERERFRLAVDSARAVYRRLAGR